MKLRPDQVAQFRAEGYLAIPWRLVEPEHLERLRERYDALFAQKRNTTGEGWRNLAIVKRDDFSEDHTESMYQITQMWSLDPLYRELLYHPPLLDVAESLIGPNIQLFHDQALYKPAHHGGEVPWHQDNGYWRCSPPELVSIWLAFDDADVENGCMHVIPGSHRLGAVEHYRARTSRGELPALLTTEIDPSRAVPVPVKAGFGMVHHCQTLHGTPPNRSPRDRRAMVIHYMAAGTKNAQGVAMKDHLLLRGTFPEETA